MSKLLIIFWALSISTLAMTVSAAQLLPNELMAEAKKHDCTQIDDFYSRPGMVKPSYVYGYMPGEEEESAAFWCKRTEDEPDKYLLIFMINDKSGEMARCDDEIEWQNYPGGLSIYYDKDLTLEHFVYIDSPQKKPPINETMKHNAVLSEYDGVSELFYCYEGEWVLLQRH